jgi:hypothetical protein
VSFSACPVAYTRTFASVGMVAPVLAEKSASTNPPVVEIPEMAMVAVAIEPPVAPWNSAIRLPAVPAERFAQQRKVYCVPPVSTGTESSSA